MGLRELAPVSMHGGGEQCQHLNQGPGNALLRLPSTSSWGGRVIPAAAPGSPHHAFITVFGGGCGMNEWDNTSHIVHATIPPNEARFDVPATVDSVAIPAYAHCVDVARVNESLWIMVHNGDGLPRACGFGSPSCTRQPIQWLAECDTGNGTTPSTATRGKPAPSLPKGFEPSNGIAWASSPSGPWKAPPAQALDGFPFCDCPALHVLHNGSVVVWCQPLTFNYVPGQEGTTINDIFINQGWGTPFQARSPRISVPKEFLTRAMKEQNAVKFDDPTLWTDDNGNWHVLAHNGDGPFPAGDNSVDGTRYRDGNPYRMGCSAHLYSADGLDWFVSPYAAHNATIGLTQDRGEVNLFRERPKAVLAPSNLGYKLVGLTSGAMRCGERPVGSRDPADPLSHCANGTWREGEQVGINTWNGFDYSFTTIVPLGK